MIKFIIVLFLIPYSGDAQRVETEYRFDSLVECRQFVFSKEYQMALISEYQGTGIITVNPACERKFIDDNFQKTGI